MIEILPSPEHVAAIKVMGTLTGEDYDRVIASIDAKLAAHERLGVLVDLTDFHDITAEAALKDLRYDLRMLFQLKRFPREAVVTDRRWLRVAAKIAGPLIPFVQIRTFGSDEVVAAMNWVADLDA
jgi:hypothetical protein